MIRNCTLAACLSATTSLALSACAADDGGGLEPGLGRADYVPPSLTIAADASASEARMYSAKLRIGETCQLVPGARYELAQFVEQDDWYHVTLAEPIVLADGTECAMTGGWVERHVATVDEGTGRPDDVQSPEEVDPTEVEDFAALQVATPYLFDHSPPGSWDFTLLRNGSSRVDVPAPCAGELITWVRAQDNVLGHRGYGNVVALRCFHNDLVWYFAHLHRLPDWGVGNDFRKGQSLGVQGSTGNSTGDHIHLELRSASGGIGDRISNRWLTCTQVEDYFQLVTHGQFIDVCGRL